MSSGGSSASSSKSSNQSSSGTNSDDRPLVMALGTAKRKTTVATQASVEETARAWPCARCGCVLGCLHLTFGILLLLLDVFTNSLSHTAYAISASLAYILCALLAFIAARRLDRCAQVLLMCFSVFAALASLSIFLESSVDLNTLCNEGPKVIEVPVAVEYGEVDESGLKDGLGDGLQNFVKDSAQAGPVVLESCEGSTHAVLTTLICIALSEFLVCMITLMVCFRSLRSAYGVRAAASPYSTLIIGDYRNLERLPRPLHTTKSSTASRILPPA